MQEQDTGIAAAVEKGTALSKRKKEKRPLRCQTILAAAHKARPVNQAASKKSKLRGPAVKAANKDTKSGLSIAEDEGSEKSSLDLWEDRIAPNTAERPAAGMSHPCLGAYNICKTCCQTYIEACLVNQGRCNFVCRNHHSK